MEGVGRFCKGSAGNRKLSSGKITSERKIRQEQQQFLETLLAAAANVYGDIDLSSLWDIQVNTPGKYACIYNPDYRQL